MTATFRGDTAPASGRYDLLVGFDGVRSAVRQHLFGEKYEPQLTGFSVWRVSLPRPAELERTVFAFAGPVKATLIPLSADDCYLALVAPEIIPQHGLSGPDIVTQMQGMLSRTDADLRLLELPVPAVQGRLAQPDQARGESAAHVTSRSGSGPVRSPSPFAASLRPRRRLPRGDQARHVSGRLRRCRRPCRPARRARSAARRDDRLARRGQRTPGAGYRRSVPGRSTARSARGL